MINGSMKSYKYILAAIFAILAMASCRKDYPAQNDEEVQADALTGTWHMISWASLTSGDIYVSFNKDGTFDLYQRLYSPIYEHLTGSWSLDGNILSGSYDDGASWRTDYSVLLKSHGNEMVLTATDDADDKATYAKAEIPDEILSGDLSLKSAESAETAPGFRFL